jgi:hypothetical protein
MARIALVLAALAAVLAVPSALAAAPDPAAFHPGSRPLGQSYENWVLRWTQWSLAYPKARSPEQNASSCSKLPQPAAPVRFVPPVVQPGAVTIRCSFPEGSPILIRVAGRTCALEDGMTAAAARASCRASALARFQYLDARLDGRLLADVRRDLVVTRVASTRLPADNVLDAPPGVVRGVVAGWFLMLRPLPVGDHVVRQRVRTDDGGIFDKTYRIRITPT